MLISLVALCTVAGLHAGRAEGEVAGGREGQANHDADQAAPGPAACCGATPPLPCVATAFAAAAVPVPCVFTGFAAEAVPLPCGPQVNAKPKEAVESGLMFIRCVVSAGLRAVLCLRDRRPVADLTPQGGCEHAAAAARRRRRRRRRRCCRCCCAHSYTQYDFKQGDISIVVRSIAVRSAVVRTTAEMMQLCLIHRHGISLGAQGRLRGRPDRGGWAGRRRREAGSAEQEQEEEEEAVAGG